MQKVATIQQILKQFSWGRVETDGTFAEPIIRAYFGVLGAEGYGYWSTPSSSNPHLTHSAIPSMDSALAVPAAAGYQHGYQLLQPQHLDDETGWKLEKRLIPKLIFDAGRAPAINTDGSVVDWDSWYRWRKLPKDSPAALLMHYPLTVYQLLVHVLGVTSPTRNSARSRQTLNVHYLGAEVELNTLPLFSELALLLPYTDINLTFFGTAVHQIVKLGKGTSLAIKATHHQAVYNYASPPSCGGGKLNIYLHGDHENWDPRLPTLLNNIPDAIVAPNAGLLSYPAWQFVILYCHAENTPFAVTEYAEQSAEVQREAFPQIVAAAMPSLSKGMSPEDMANMVRSREYPIQINPFQRPGQRCLGSTRLPNVPNGFTMRVVGNDLDTAKKTQVPVIQEEQDQMKTSSGSLDTQALLNTVEKLSLNSLD
ncbi:hypothetical protein BJ138DRAFT_998114 [Hygrophoropsis aurantiaca]|uniref:Uncharacterized protein n=1 Tax=Hygrophoropsis aurantiaca TaxID=72124 RepID=A0ACB8AQS1_9AGAM|nr:hypothetical protein BJ138DRAFT_998114 [Hygrophoropsis aurantiaca]